MSWAQVSHTPRTRPPRRGAFPSHVARRGRAVASREVYPEVDSATGTGLASGMVAENGRQIEGATATSLFRLQPKPSEVHTRPQPSAARPSGAAFLRRAAGCMRMGPVADVAYVWTGNERSRTLRQGMGRYNETAPALCIATEADIEAAVGIGDVAIAIGIDTDCRYRVGWVAAASA